MKGALCLLGLFLGVSVVVGSGKVPHPCTEAPKTQNTQVVISYECLDGFIADNSASSATCSATSNSASFSPDQGLVCLPVCPAPRVIADASIISSDPALTIESATRSVTYKCNAGFVKVSGDDTLECSNGAFTGDSIECVRICEAPPALNNAVVSSLTPAGNTQPSQVAVYECVEGFIQAGDANTLTCERGSGVFTGTKIECVPVCPAPRTIADASIISSDPALTIESATRSVTYKCNAGFVKVSGDDTLECSNGAFTGDSIKCVKACPSPPPAQANAVVATSVPAGSDQIAQVVTYKCIAGFGRVSKSNSLQCKRGSGEFVGSGIKCVPVCKKNLPVPKRGRPVKYVLNSHGFPETAYFSCFGRFWVDPREKNYYSKCVKGEWRNGNPKYLAARCVPRIYH